MEKRTMSRRALLRAGFLLGSAAALAACGGTPPAVPSPTTAPAAANPTSAPAAPAPSATRAPAAATPTAVAAQVPARVVTVKDHFWLGFDDFWKEQREKFEKETPNIKVEYEWFNRGELHEKQIILAASNLLGDVMAINVAPLVSELAAKELLREHDSLFAQDKSADIKQYWPGQIETYTVKGKVYGLPQLGHPGAIIQYLNLDIIEANGAKVPPRNGNWTTDDLVTLAQACTKAADGTYALAWSQGYQEGIVAWMRSYGGDFFNREGTRCLVNTPESKRAVAFLYSLWQEYKVALPIDPPQDSWEYFKQGKAALHVATPIRVGQMPTQVGNKFRYEFSLNPVGPRGRGTQVSSAGRGLARSSKNMDAAWTWLKYMTGKEVGVAQALTGALSPGSRFDVWSDPRLIQAFPPFKDIGDAVVNATPFPAAWHYPANGRFSQAWGAATPIFNEMFKGSLGPNEACDQVQAAVQQVMDLPLV